MANSGITVDSGISSTAPTRGQYLAASAFKSRVALIGDSITSYSTTYQTLPTSAGSFLVANKVATLNLGTTCQVFSGNYFLLLNSGDPLMSMVDNGRVIKAITGSTGQTSSNTLTFATSQADGDYSNLYGSTWQINHFQDSTDSGYFSWLNTVSRGQFILVANYGGVGMTSSQLVLQMDKILSGPAFDIAHICIGTNDLQAAGVTTAAAVQAAVITIFANIQTAVNRLLAYGASIVLCTPPPYGTGVASATVRTPGMDQLRILIYKLAQSNTNITVLDIFRECIAGNVSANGGGFITNASTDGIHPAANVLCKAARNQSQVSLQKLFPILDPNLVHIMDDDVNFAQSGIGFPNCLQNAGSTGVGGTLVGGATGSCADTWRLTLQGGATSVAGTGGFTRTAVGNSNSANWGFANRVTAAFSAAAQGFKIEVNADNPSKIVAGYYRAGIGIYVRTNTVGIGTIVGTWNLGGNVALAHASGNATNSFDWLAGETYWLTSNVLFVNAVPLDSILAWVVTSAAAGSCDLEFFGGFIRQIDNPYA